MKPEDVRDLSWSQKRRLVSGDRLRVYLGLLQYGPATTRELARKLGMDVLGVRPRVTELCYLELARMARRRGTEGVYVGVVQVDIELELELASPIRLAESFSGKFEQLLFGFGGCHA